MTAVTAAATSDVGMQLLTKLGEAGGITGMVALVLVMLIRLIQKNGCTFKCYSCSGQTVVELDCEEGAPSEHFNKKGVVKTPKQTSTVSNSMT